jgi:hypothetical protein
MKSHIAALGLFLASTAGAMAEYDATGRLRWTWDGSFLPPVIAGPGFDYPSQRQANQSFAAARDGGETTIDFAALNGLQVVPAGVFLYACKNGGYDAYRHIVQDVGDVVHCVTFFLDENGERLYKRTVNFQKADRESWTMQLPMTALPGGGDAQVLGDKQTF